MTCSEREFQIKEFEKLPSRCWYKGKELGFHEKVNFARVNGSLAHAFANGLISHQTMENLIMRLDEVGPTSTSVWD